MQLKPILFILALSINQPKFCANASWGQIATTFANSSVVGTQPIALFVNTNNTVFVARQDNGQILIWRNASVNPTTTLGANISNPQSLFATSDEQIFVDNGNTSNRVDRWMSNGTALESPMSTFSSWCSGLFVDVMDNLYCSLHSQHRVVRRSLLSPSSVIAIAAGTGCQGSTSDMLSSPRGIFVTVHLDLYVADCGNDRVQLFRSGQMIGTTVVGNGSNETIPLTCPSGVVLDGDGYLFVVDQGRHRILGSGPDGFRCVAACFMQGSTSADLSDPFTMSFDRDGNLFVADQTNNRIQTFLLSNNACGKSQGDRKDFSLF